MIEKQEFRDWLNHPVTKTVFKILEQDRENHQLALLATQNLSNFPNPLLVVGSHVGSANTITSLLNFDYVSLGKQEDDDGNNT
jgi:hypothetical protein